MEFPNFNNQFESSDDTDSPEQKKRPSADPLHEYEPHGDREQGQGVIYLRPPALPPKLFELISEQRSPAAKAEKPASAQTPEVSMPSEPEVRTLDPRPEGFALPPDFEQLATDRTAEIPDDEDDDDDDMSPKKRPAAAAPKLTPKEKERFDDIMRKTMDESFTNSTSGDELDAADDDAAEDDAEEELPAAAAEPLASSSPPEAFYYDESDPAAGAAAADFTATSASTASPRAAFASGGRGGGTSGGGGTGTSGPGGGSGPAPGGSPPAGGGGGSSGGGGRGGGPGGGTWGMGPIGPGGGFGGPAWGPAPAAFNAMPVPPGTGALAGAAANTLANTAYEAERRGLRRGLVAGFITGWLLKSYLARRKLKRFEQATDKQFKEQDERIQQLSVEQQAAQQKLAAYEERLRQERREAAFAPKPKAEEASLSNVTPDAAERIQPEQPAVQHASAGEAPLQYPGPAGAEQPFAQSSATAGGAFEQAFQQPVASEIRPQQQLPAVEQSAPPGVGAASEAPGQPYKLRPGEHFEQAAGGQYIVVDAHGREVQNTMQYGQELQSERRREQGVATFTGGSTSNGGGAGGSTSGGTHSSVVTGLNGAEAGVPVVSGLPAGQIDWGHQLPADARRSALNPQPLLPAKPSISFLSLLTSPWLWGALIVLLLAFFAAAFI